MNESYDSQKNSRDEYLIRRSYINNGKTLPLNNQTDINGHLIYTYPYSILNTFPDYKDYLMEHYIQCFGFINESNDITFEYEDGIGYNNMFNDPGPFDFLFYPYNVGLQLNIKDTVISAINSNHYVVVFTDEYYIKNRPSYKKTHFLHELIISSYDKNTFACLAFDENHKLSFSSFPQKNIKKAYKRGNKINIPSATNWISDKSIILIKPKVIQNQYLFSQGRFAQKLKSYFNGELNSVHNSYIISQEKCYVGVYNTNLILHCLTNPDNNTRILYPAVHAWYESKKNLLHKLKYYFEKADNVNDTLLFDYEKHVVDKADLIRMIILKYRRSGKINTENMIFLLSELFDSEKNIGNDILNIISQF